MGLIAVFVLIVINGVCVAGEFALVAVDRSRLEVRAEAGSRGARIAMSLLNRLSFHLAGAQLGITVTSLILGLLAEDTIGQLFTLLPGIDSTSGFGVAVGSLAFATALQMIFGELAPKNLAISQPMRVSVGLAPILRVYGVIAAPVIAGFDGVANRIVRALGIEPTEEMHSTRTMDDLEYLVRSSREQGTLSEQEVALLIRTMQLSGKDAADALTARTAMTAVRVDAPLSDLVDRSIDTGFSRFPVVGADADDIVGYVDVRDVFRLDVDRREGATVSDVVRDALVVPESRELDGVLQDLLGAGTRMAIVVDEHGGTAGLITLEDILEELVGDIADEYDREVDLTVVQRGDTYVLDGTLRPDEVADLIDLELPSGPYETLAGFLLQQFDSVPDVGDELAWGGWRLRVAALDRLRVSSVEVTRMARPAESGTTGGAR